MTWWQLWRDHPEKWWVREVFFQIHFWLGAILSGYIFVMSLSGSIAMFRNELSNMGFSVERIVEFHTHLLAGSIGSALNGIGGISLTLLCLTGAVIWWPGIDHWRRSLTVQWHASFARVNWDLHSALGFWCFVFVLGWGVSGVYLAQPDRFNALFRLDPFGSAGVWLARLHFSTFGWWLHVIWAVLGLVPAVLAFTGMFICCRRMIFKKPSNPRSYVP